MSPFVITATSGWAATLMILATLTLPYLLRRAAGPGYRQRFQAHVWIGYAIAAVTLLHIALGLTPALLGSAEDLGIMLAIAAAAVMALQVVFGARMNGAAAVDPGLRRLHFLGMLLIVGLVAFHAVINSPLFPDG